MKKRITILILSALLVLSQMTVAVFAENEAIYETVIDASSHETAQQSGLPLSGAYSKSGSYTLNWKGHDLKRAIKLPTQTDWSSGEFLEFWFYSPVKTTSSFGVAIISDNAQTSCTDYYETRVEASFKGWQLVSIPFAELTEVHKPKGFSSIDRVELWPNYGEFSIAEEAVFYFDNWYVTNVQSENVGVTEDEYVLADFTSQSQIDKSGVALQGANSTVSKMPDTGTTAICWSDAPRRDDGGSWGIYFLDLPISDWSVYNTLEIELFSKNASGAILDITCHSENPNQDGADYYYEEVSVEWTNERHTLQLRIGPNGNQSTSRRPLGWDKITSFQLWMSRNKTNPDPVGATELYIESIKLKNIDYSKLWAENQYLSSGPETDNWFDFAAKINEIYPENEHPRLLASQEDIDRIKNTYKDDPWLKGSVEALLANSDRYIEMRDTFNDTSTAADRATSLSLAYLITGEQKYKDAVWEKWKCISLDASTWTPNSQSMLYLGQTANDAAISYDLMYNHWTEEERRIARNAIVMFGLKPVRSTVLSQNGAGNQETNWNPVINSGVGLAAMAIADEEGYGELANLFLNRLYRAVDNCFQHYAPDGGGYEGPDYWSYLFSRYLPYEYALYRSVGEENYDKFSALLRNGLDVTSEFAIHVVGPTGQSFNFSDGNPRGIAATGDFWFAELFDKPEYAGIRSESPNADPYNIMMYTPNDGYATWREKMPLDYQCYGVTQFGSMRTSFEKGTQGFYVGYKGNNANPSTHARLDAGTFVLEALGTRWICQLPSEDYSMKNVGSTQRWTYYRNRAEGSNTLVIDPMTAQGPFAEDSYTMAHASHTDQKRQSESPIIEAESAVGAAYAVLDLTDAYSESATSVKRGYALVDNRNAFLLQDEITVKKSCEVYSFMHTEADIEVSDDGKSAILSKNGKQMKVRLLGPDNATLAAMECEQLPGPEEKVIAAGTDNSIYKKLAVKANVSSAATISLLVTPYYGEGLYEYSPEQVLPINQWSKLLSDPVELSAIYVNNTPLASFKTGQTSYIVKEDTVYSVSASADAGINLEITQADKIGGTALIKATDREDNTTVYTVTFTDETQRRLDEWDYYAPVEILSSSNHATAANVIDGDVETEWSNPTSEWIAFDLGKQRDVSEVQLLWKKNNERVETFDISVSNDGENWTVVWEGDSVLSSEMVSYKFDTVKARFVKVNGHINTQNTYTTIMEFYVTSMGAGFTDIDNSWAKQAIEDMTKVGLLEGTSDSTFSPEEPLSRAAFLTMLARAFNAAEGTYTGKISDVGENDWFMPYIESAYSLNLIPEAMFSEGEFMPNENITREEICALTISFWEHYVGETAKTSIEKFKDKDEISEWAVPYIEKCLAERIIAGISEDTFAPKNNATRAQAATILKRIYIKIS